MFILLALLCLRTSVLVVVVCSDALLYCWTVAWREYSQQTKHVIREMRAKSHSRVDAENGCSFML